MRSHESSPSTRNSRRKLGRAFAGLVAASLLLLVYSTDWLAALGAAATGQRLQRIERSPHFSHGIFHNLVPSHLMAPGKFWQMLREQFFGGEQREPSKPVPVVRRVRADYVRAPASGLRATWIGHATVLLEIEGRRVLTDPIWSERASPSRWIGPERLHPVPIALAQLPPIDAVVISHDHYDHLDMATIRALAARGPTMFVVPLGIGADLEAWGVPAARIVELDWNESALVAGLRFTATPDRHYSSRSLWDGDTKLWASWVIAGQARRVFFSGDSGYFSGFAAVGRAHGPFDLTLVKIGAYDPTWPDIHMTPEEAVQTHLDLRGKVLLPIHWGTFKLAFHAWEEPAERALTAARARGVELALPRPGEFVEPGGAAPLPNAPFWR